jgi:diguanylate cyclase (GGDEF)-like protein
MDAPSPNLSHHILDNSPMAIVITDDTGLVLWCNRTLNSWLSCLPSACVGRTELALLGKGQPDQQGAATPSHNGPFSLGLTQNGTERRVLRYPLPPSKDRHTICYMDISDEENLRLERNRLAQQLEQHNTVDPVSGLLNAQAIDKGLEPLISRSRRYQNPLSVVTMHITNLHEVGQTMGQVAVDKIVVAVSQMLRDQLRWADMVGRLDDGQFIFILPETDKEASVALANKLASQLNELSVMLDEQNSSRVMACFGVSAWRKGDDARLLMSRSKDAAQTAQQNGAFTVEAA